MKGSKKMKKRLVAILLVLAMMMALFAGCGAKGESNPDISPDDQIENPVDKDEDTDQDTDHDDSVVEDGDTPTDNEGGQKPGNGSGNNTGDKEEGNEGSAGSSQIKGSLTDLVEKIYGITKIDQAIGIETNFVDLGNKDLVLYNLGLEDVSGVKEAVVSEALMTTQAYSMALVRAKEGGNAEAIAKQIKNGIDPQKWICVIADDVSVVVYDDVIMLVMINSGMDDVATSKTIKAAMDEISGIKGKVM